MEIRDYWTIIWKRKFTVFLCLLVAGLSGFVYSYIYQKPVYSATSRILVDQPNRVILITEGMSNMQSPLSVETQRKLLKSRPVAERAAEKLGWASESAFQLLSIVNAVSDEDTGIIHVTVEGENPERCSKIANSYAHAFEDISREFAEKSFNESLAYIKEQLDNAERTLQQKEMNIFEFNQAQGIILLNDKVLQLSNSITNFEMRKLQTELDAKLIETELANLQNLFRDKTLLIAQDTSILMDDSVITNLRGQLANLEVDRAVKLVKYKPEHPVIKELDGKLSRLNAQLDKHITDVINNRLISPFDYSNEQAAIVELNTQLLLTRTTMDNIDAMTNRLKAEQLKYPKLQYEYTRLDREKEIAEKLFILLYEQHQKAMIEQVRRDVRVRVFDEAQTPGRPIRPNRVKNMAIAIMFGFLIGIGLAFLLEEMEETIRTTDDVKNYLNLPVLGSIPYSAETINKLITDVPLKSPIAEAYRRLSFFAQLFCLDPPIKTLLVTSSKSDEGKSTTLANLAISMAQEGTKVLIVDTDLRRPMLHRMFGVDNSLGLSSILTGELEAEIAVSDLSISGHLPKESFMDVIVDRLIQPVSIKGLNIIPSGPLPANSIELLRSERMLAFLRCIERKADIVIFDSPPAIHVIDAVVLSQILDGVLFVINSGRINRDEAMQVKYMIESTKTPIIGIALNNIEASSPDYYYYYYYGGYGYGSRQRRKRVKLKR